jgi:ornithine cyclodeaminase
VILAIGAGATSADQLVTLSGLIRREVNLATDRPRLFKSTGMSWEDAVVASALTKPT